MAGWGRSPGRFEKTLVFGGLGGDSQQNSTKLKSQDINCHFDHNHSLKKIQQMQHKHIILQTQYSQVITNFHLCASEQQPVQQQFIQTLNELVRRARPIHALTLRTQASLRKSFPGSLAGPNTHHYTALGLRYRWRTETVGCCKLCLVNFEPCGLVQPPPATMAGNTKFCLKTIKLAAQSN